MEVNRMKSRATFIWQITISAGALFAVANLCAQEVGGNQPDNPFFRQHMAASPSPTAGGSTTTKGLSAKDKNFLTNATSSGAWEVETGKMAEKKAKNETTRQIAARMVADHSQANKELIDLAKKKGLGISAAGIKGQQIGEANYDENYLNLLQQDHQEQIKAFEKEAKSGDDTDIKNWAARRLPTLKQHLAEVKAASSKPK
jgi:putative membrane protein